MDSWDIASIPLSVVVFALHTYGLFLLWKLRHTNGSRDCLIAGFSLSNILFVFYNVVRFPIDYYAPIVFEYLSVVVEGLRIPFYGSMILLTTERFLEVYLHMKYQNYCFNQHKLKYAVSLWILFIIWLAATIPLLSMAANREEMGFLLVDWTSKRLFVGFHFLIVIQFLFVYTYIYVKIKTTKCIHQFVQRRHNRKKLFIPFFIVVTFIFFDTVPDMYIVFGDEKYESWVLLLFRIDTLFNAVIYLFLQPRVKKRLSRHFRESRMVTKMENVSMVLSGDKRPQRKQAIVHKPRRKQAVVLITTEHSI